MKQFTDDGARYYDYFEHGLPGDVNFYLDEAQRANGHVVEIGAGTGRVLIPLAKEGIEITGVEPAQDMMQILKQKVEDLHLSDPNQVELLQATMQSFEPSKPVSKIIIPYRAFQHLLTAEEQRRALKHFHDVLDEGGEVVFNVVEPTAAEIEMYTGSKAAATQFDSRFRYPSTGNDVFVWYSRQYFPQAQRIEQLFIFEELNSRGEVIRKSYTPILARYTFQQEFRYLFEICGFKVKGLYGDFDRKEYVYGDEQIWIIQKV